MRSVSLLCSVIGALAARRVGSAPRDLAIGGLPLTQPLEFVSKGGGLSVVLPIDTFRFEKNTPVKFTTRSYNGSIPGPTFRVRAGDTLTIKLVNNLGPDQDGPINTFHSANTSNLHTHGLHISPMGNADDVFRKVAPGTSATFQYDIAADHAPGTYWYHPHAHGAGAIQLSSLMAGALIVEPANPDVIPPEIAAMKQVVMVLHNLCFDHDPLTMNPYDDHSIISQYALNNVDPKPEFIAPDDEHNYYLVNGQYQPVVTMVPGEIQYWRLVHASHSINLELLVDGCKSWVLARDGVYLSSPREDNVPYLVPGSRVDIAVRCDAAGTYDVRSAPGLGPYDNDLQPYTKVFDGTLFTISVSGTPKTMTPPSRLPALPAYLSDLTHLKPSDIAGRFSVELEASFGPVTPGTFPDYYQINNKRFNGPNDYIYTMKLGAVQEWSLKAAGGGVNHPFHIHVNHFQILNFTDDRKSLVDMEIGEWRDTVPTVDGLAINVRFRPDKYDGVAVLHCHMAAHADLGMMAVAYISKNGEGDAPGGKVAVPPRLTSRTRMPFLRRTKV